MSQKIIFDTIMSLNNLFGIFIAIRFYNGFLERKSLTKYKSRILFFIIVFFETTCNIATKNLNITILIAYIAYFMIALLFYQGEIHIKMIGSSFIVIFSIITEFLTAILFIPVFNLEIQKVRDNLLLLFLGGMVSNLLLMLVFEIIVRIFSPKAERVSINSWMLIITIPIISIYISIASVYRSVLTNKFSLELVCLCFSILYINLIAFYLFDYIITQTDENNQRRYREKQLLIQQKQYQNILFGYEQVKKVRHDMLNHLIALDSYLESAKYHEAKMYIAKLHGELDNSVKEIISGNIIIDALINNRKKEIANNEINFSIDIVIPGKLNIDDMDLCIVIGNALDNAYEACQRMNEEDEAREIHLTMKYNKGNLLINLRNSYNNSTIKRSIGKYVSSKEGRNHNSYGLGISNMISIVEKYGGALKTELKKDCFELNMVIPDKMIR